MAGNLDELKEDLGSLAEVSANAINYVADHEQVAEEKAEALLDRQASDRQDDDRRRQD